MQLITGIQNWVHSSLPDDIVTRQRLVPLSYAEARDAIAKPLASTTPAPSSLRRSNAIDRVVSNEDAGR